MLLMNSYVIGKSCISAADDCMNRLNGDGNKIWHKCSLRSTLLEKGDGHSEI